MVSDSYSQFHSASVLFRISFVIQVTGVALCHMTLAVYLGGEVNAGIEVSFHLNVG